MKKTLVGFTLALAVTISLLCTAFAAGKVYTEGTLYYTLEDNSITITGYFGREKEVTVPAMIAGYPVNVIGSGAFVGTNAEKINLPDTIMTVSSGAVDGGQTLVYNSNTNAPQEHGGSNSGGSSHSSGDSSGNMGTPQDPQLPEQQPVAADNADTPAVDDPNDGLVEETLVDIDAVDAAEDLNHGTQVPRRTLSAYFWVMIAVAVLALACILLLTLQKKKKKH